MKKIIYIIIFFAVPCCNEVVENEMVLIPEGYFISGLDSDDPRIMNFVKEWFPNEDEAFCKDMLPDKTKRKDNIVPSKEVHLESFYIDKYEVSRAAYLDCVKAGQCRKPDIHFFFYPNLPVVKVSYPDAKNYCRFVGKRLPTDREWEKAARGPNGNLFPWGDHDDECYHANTKNINEGEECKSYYGIYNMIRNVWEWTVPIYDPDSKFEAMIMGGGLAPGYAASRRLYKDRGITVRAKHIGFRCAKDVAVKKFPAACVPKPVHLRVSFEEARDYLEATTGDIPQYKNALKGVTDSRVILEGITDYTWMDRIQLINPQHRGRSAFYSPYQKSIYIRKEFAKAVLTGRASILLREGNHAFFHKMMLNGSTREFYWLDNTSLNGLAYIRQAEYLRDVQDAQNYDITMNYLWSHSYDLREASYFFALPQDPEVLSTGPVEHTFYPSLDHSLQQDDRCLK